MKAEYQNQSVQRAMLIMETIGHSEQGLSLAELSRQLDLNKSIAYRLLITLEAGGWLRRDAQSGRYYVGIKLLSISGHALDNLSVREMLLPHMQSLAKQTGETVVLVMYDDYQAICIEKIESESNVRITAELGKQYHLHAGATGLAVLMGMPDDLLRQVLTARPLKRFSAATVTDVDQLCQLLQEARQQGYVYSASTVDKDVAALGIPISFAQEQVYLGLSVIGPEYRYTKKKRTEIAALLLQLTERLLPQQRLLSGHL